MGPFAVIFAGGGLPCKGAIMSFGFRHKKVLMSAMVVYGIIKIKQFLRMRKLRASWDNAGQDVVVIHSIKRSKLCPDVSPFTLKLQTFLRMTNIPYQMDYEEPMGPKQKLPWITLNGRDMADSQLIINHLKTTYQKDVNSRLTQEEQAVAHAFRVMTEEHTLWGLAHWRFVEDNGRGFRSYMPLPKPFMFILSHQVKKTVKKATYFQGIGRHSLCDIHDITIKNIASISKKIGSKQFLMGDEPCEEDCAIFGFLCQFIWQSPGSPYTRAINADYRNLLEYCERMKAKYWPDWENQLWTPSRIE